MAGGWDERIYNWGQDDRDLMESIFYLHNVTKYRVTDKKFTIFHLWHEPVLYDNHGGLEQNTKNIQILNDNVKQERKNAINSYWKVRKVGESNPVVKTD
jgi:hypothetical protein